MGVGGGSGVWFAMWMAGRMGPDGDRSLPHEREREDQPARTPEEIEAALKRRSLLDRILDYGHVDPPSQSPLPRGPKGSPRAKRPTE